MKSLDSLKMQLYTKYNLSSTELRDLYKNKIVKDTLIFINEQDTSYDSLLVIQTKDFLFGIGKSIKRKEWNLVCVYSSSEIFFSEFGLDKQTMLSDIESIYDSTNSYSVGNDKGLTNKFAISFSDTDEFIHFIEFIFYFQSDSLKAISFDVHENM